jgi:hypothetical protein
VSWLETRRIPVLFAVATLLPIAALCRPDLRTLQQDRDLERAHWAAAADRSSVIRPVPAGDGGEVG